MVLTLPYLYPLPYPTLPYPALSLREVIGPSKQEQFVTWIKGFAPPSWLYDTPAIKNTLVYNFTMDRTDKETDMPITSPCSKIIYVCIFLNIVTLSIDRFVSSNS